MLSLTIDLLLTINVIVSLLIILVVLMQKPKSEGLGSAFGGGMTENLFGAQTSNVLANFTRWLGGIFFFLSLILSILYAKQSTERSSIQAALLKSAMTEPAATPEPAASPAATINGGELKLGVSAPSPNESLLPTQEAPAKPAPATQATQAPKVTAPTPKVTVPAAKPAAPAPAAAASPAKSGTR